MRNPTLLSGTSTWIDRNEPQKKATIIATIGTGGDDLRGGGNNVKIVITFKNSTAKLVYENINNGANWGNFTEHTATKELSSLPNLTVNDIKEVELWHRGGTGFDINADNWDVDKFTLSITINGIVKQLVDKNGAPLHRFTGDARKKIFVVE